MNEDIASNFILMAVQDWPGLISEERSVRAVQDILGAAGFDAQATCRPVFGGIWPQGCTGPDAEVATAFLNELTDTLQPKRGHFEDEVAHVWEFLEAHVQAALG